MPNLSAYVRRIKALPGIDATVNSTHIKHGYYSIRALNPNGIVPLGPA
jgi:putative glutathione S-transferase